MTAAGRIEQVGTTLTEATTDDINRLFYSYRGGEYLDVKSRAILRYDLSAPRYGSEVLANSFSQEPIETLSFRFEIE